MAALSDRSCLTNRTCIPSEKASWSSKWKKHRQCATTETVLFVRKQVSLCLSTDHFEMTFFLSLSFFASHLSWSKDETSNVFSYIRPRKISQQTKIPTRSNSLEFMHSWIHGIYQEIMQISGTFEDCILRWIHNLQKPFKQPSWRILSKATAIDDAVRCAWPFFFFISIDFCTLRSLLTSSCTSDR